jgi:hypothetical protein
VKTFQMAIGLLSALLLANPGSAENLTIQWWVTGWPAGTGWLPKIAASGGLTGSGALIYQTATGDAKFEYWDGQMVFTEPNIFNWDGYYYVTSATQPSDEVGHEPSIAMVTCPVCSDFTSDVIEVHQGGQDNGAALWYRTGVDSGLETTWAASHKYDEGYNPTVAVDQSGGTSSTTVVEVHQGGVDSSELWYHVGTLTYSASSASVTWGPSHKTGFTGYAPTVSVARGVVVLVAQGTAPQMWYSIGTVDTSTNTINNWSAQNNYDNGYNPSVSVQSCGGGSASFGCDFVVVEAHQEGKSTGSLMYRLGKMHYGTGGSAPTSIKWTPNADTDYATGCYPSVGLMTYGTDDTDGSTTYPLVESHSAACGGPAFVHTSWGYLQLN